MPLSLENANNAPSVSIPTQTTTLPPENATVASKVSASIQMSPTPIENVNAASSVSISTSVTTTGSTVDVMRAAVSNDMSPPPHTAITTPVETDTFVGANNVSVFEDNTSVCADDVFPSSLTPAEASLPPTINISTTKATAVTTPEPVDDDAFVHAGDTFDWADNMHSLPTTPPELPITSETHCIPQNDGEQVISPFLTVNNTYIPPILPPHNLSCLHSTLPHLFLSLRCQCGRPKNLRKAPRQRFSHFHSPYPVNNSMFIHRHPSGIAPGKPTITIPFGITQPSPFPKLNWDQDPRLINLSSALRALGWTPPC